MTGHLLMPPPCFLSICFFFHGSWASSALLYSLSYMCFSLSGYAFITNCSTWCWVLYLHLYPLWHHIWSSPRVGAPFSIFSCVWSSTCFHVMQLIWLQPDCVVKMQLNWNCVSLSAFCGCPFGYFLFRRGEGIRFLNLTGETLFRGWGLST